MENSAYWRSFSRRLDGGGGKREPFGRENKAGKFGNLPPVYFGGRLLPLEDFWEVPTFIRQGKRLAI